MYKKGDVECWKVQNKQTTKYAYEGSVGFINLKPTLAVDQVKPIKKVN